MFTWTLLPAYLRPQWVLPTLLNSRSTLCPTGASPPKMQYSSNFYLLQLGSLEWVHVRGGCHQVSDPHSGLHWEGHHCGWSGEEKTKGKGCWNKLFRWNWPGSSCCSRRITGEVWSGLTTSRSSTRPQDWLRQPSLFNSRPLKQRREISNLKCDTSQRYLTALTNLKSYFDLIFRDEQKKQQCSCSAEAGLHQTEERPGTSVNLLVSPPNAELFPKLAGALHRCWASPFQPARMALCGQVENTIHFILQSGLLIWLWRFFTAVSPLK